MYISVDKFVGSDDTVVTSRIDSHPATTAEWSISSDGRGLFHPSPYKFVRSLRDSDKWVVRYKPFMESPRTIEFNTSGFSEIGKKVR